MPIDRRPKKTLDTYQLTHPNPLNFEQIPEATPIKYSGYGSKEMVRRINLVGYMVSALTHCHQAQ